MSELFSQFLTHVFAAWNRRGLAVAIAWVMAFLGWSVISFMPDQYRSQALVRIDTASILEPLLRGLTIKLESSAEVRLLEKSLISRPNIEQVVRETGLDQLSDSKSDTERLIKVLASRLELVRQNADLFSIGFEDEDPQLAHDVVQSLLAILVKGNPKRNRSDMDSARRFIEDQIAVYEAKLSEAERRIANFYQANPDYLPGQGNPRNTLAVSQKQLLTLESDLRAAQLRRSTLKDELKSVAQYLAPNTVVGGGPQNRTATLILNAQRTLDGLKLSYTDKHPDVVMESRRLEALFKLQTEEMAAAEANADNQGSTAKVKGPPNPVYGQIKVQIVQQEVVIAGIKDQIVASREDLEKSKILADRNPEVQIELVRLNRDYKILTDNYNRLLASRETETISRAREDQVQSIRFSVLEPPIVPTIPSGPNRLLFLSMVLIVSLGSGIGVSVLLSVSSENFTSVADLKAVLGIPVLGTVSIAAAGGHGFLDHSKSIAFWLTALTLFAAFAALWFVESQLGLNEVLMDEILAKLPEGFLQRLPAL